MTMRLLTAGRHRSAATALAFGLAALLGPAAAGETPRASAVYDLTYGGFTVGKIVLGVEIPDGRYAASLTGKVRGLARLFSSGSGKAESAGSRAPGRLAPDRFAMTVVDDDGRSDTDVRLAGGNVTAVSLDPPDRRAKARVPVSGADRRGVRDPISALVVPQKAEGPVPQDCEQTLPVFDGLQRYDIELRYKGHTSVKAEDGTYRGPALVCRARYVPISGHRRGRKSVEEMAKRDIEVWLAPAGRGVLLPFRLAIPTGYGTLVATARKFFPAE